MPRRWQMHALTNDIFAAGAARENAGAGPGPRREFVKLRHMGRFARKGAGPRPRWSIGPVGTEDTVRLDTAEETVRLARAEAPRRPIRPSRRNAPAGRVPQLGGGIRRRFHRSPVQGDASESAQLLARRLSLRLGGMLVRQAIPNRYPVLGPTQLDPDECDT